MDISKRPGCARQRAGQPAGAWRLGAALLVLLLLGGCSRLLSIVDPTAF